MMFTGIVEEIGRIKELGSHHVMVEAAAVLRDLKKGDSIAINGVCLTVTALDKTSFTVDIMPETIRRTTFNSLRYGDGVNLERALPAQGRIGGHFVQGHIDAVGRVSSMTPEAEAVIMSVSLESELSRYLVTKGFIAVDGVSLTVVDCGSSFFSVSLVSYTRENTTLGKRRAGEGVNLEVDIMAKYLEKYSQRKTDAVLSEFLQGYGASAQR